MKTFLLAALATSLVATPALTATPAAAQARQTQKTVTHKPNGAVVVKKRTVKAPVRNPYRAKWYKGQRFNRAEARNYRQISNWRQYQNRRLYAPPRGYQWVQSGNDAVLVAVASGVIGAVLGGVFN